MQKMIKSGQSAETLKCDVATPFHLEIIFRMYNFMDKNSMTSQIQSEIYFFLTGPTFMQVVN